MIPRFSIKLLFLSTLLTVLFGFLYGKNDNNEIIVGGEYVNSEIYLSKSKLDSLEKLYAVKKSYPEKYKVQILFALAHFPELKETEIDFVERKVFAPLSAVPVISSMISPLGKRKYRVVISTSSNTDMERILLKNLPINAQIGVLGHELSHIIDYRNRSFSDLLVIAINYSINPAYHSWYEKRTDLKTVEKGLGWELYAYSKYVRTLFGSEERQANLSEDFYLHFNEILFEMQKTELYNIYFQPNSINRD